LNDGQPVVVKMARKDRSVKLRRCMVCVGQALYVCEACPLRVCAECHTYLKKMCECNSTSTYEVQADVSSGKHHLDNLFYFYDRQHIRNDVSAHLVVE
jgi:hypothetical protein